MLCGRLGGPLLLPVHGPEEFDMPPAAPGDKGGSEFVAAITRSAQQALPLDPARALAEGDGRALRVDDASRRPRPQPPPRRAWCVCRPPCEQKGQLLLLSAAREMAQRGEDFELVLGVTARCGRSWSWLVDEYRLCDRVDPGW